MASLLLKTAKRLVHVPRKKRRKMTMYEEAFIYHEVVPRGIAHPSCKFSSQYIIPKTTWSMLGGNEAKYRFGVRDN